MVATITSKIEFAFGANLTADPATWTWTDVTAYALGSVSVRPGRQDEASQTQPAQCIFRLANTDARFTPRHPTSLYYPNFHRQIPVRVSLNPGTGYVQRFQGYIDVITPTWPSGNSTVAEVSITASGILRRLGQGSKPLRSAPVRYIPTTSPVAYWPLEDGPLVSFGTPLVGSGTFQAFTGTHPSGAVVTYPQFGQGQLAPWLPPVISRSGAAGLTIIYGTVSMPGFTNTWTADLIYNSNTGAGDGAIDINPSYLGGSLGWPQIQFYPSVRELWVAMNGEPEVTASAPTLYDGNAHHIRWTVSPSGSKVTWTVYVDGVLTNTGTTAGNMTVPAVNSIASSIAATSGPAAVGHVAVWTSPPSLNTAVSAAFGWRGETATARLTRLCLEEGVPLTVTGTATTLMGPQATDTLISLLRECEAVDLGILYDGAGPGLSYLARPARYNQAAAIALDCKMAQVKLPFLPVEDDQRVRNDWTVTRRNGGTARYADQGHIAANGLYDTSATINTASDSDLGNQASWRVYLGTGDEMRVPSLTFDPLHSPELQSQWLATTLGERLTATNLPTQFPYGSADQIIEGYTETWDSVSWFVTPNLSPYRPWEVFQIQDTRLGRIEHGGSQLHQNYSAGATSLLVDTISGGLWDTASTPFDVDIRGLQIHVTAISGGSSPQTFTVTATPGDLGGGNPVKLWKPGVLAL
jgi:hypothetical protein